MTKLAPISKMISFSTIQGFLKRYITIFYVSWLRNGKLSNLEVQKKSLKKSSFTTKINIILTFFSLPTLTTWNYTKEIYGTLWKPKEPWDFKKLYGKLENSKGTQGNPKVP